MSYVYVLSCHNYWKWCFLTVFRSSKVFARNPAAPKKGLDNWFTRDWWGLPGALPIFTWLCESLSTCQKYSQKTGEHPFEMWLHCCCCFWLWFQIKLADEVRAFNLQGEGVELDPKGLLSINENTGEISVHYAVDYEQYQLLKVLKGNFSRLCQIILLLLCLWYMYIHYS